MQKRISFQEHQKKIDLLINNYYEQLHTVNSFEISAIEKLSPIVNFVINFSSKRYEYVSENAFELFGITADQIKMGGLKQSIKFFWQEHLSLFVDEIFPLILKWFSDFAKTGRDIFKTKLTYTICMVNTEGKILSTSHLIRPLRLDPSGLPVLAVEYIYEIKDMSKHVSPEMKFEEKDKNNQYKLLWNKVFSMEIKNTFSLSLREKEVLALIKKGYSSRKIADVMCLSLYTINNHRKNIAKKCNVKNLFEALHILNN